MIYYHDFLFSLYQAKEVVERGEVTPKSDMYALGITLFQVMANVSISNLEKFSYNYFNPRLHLGELPYPFEEITDSNFNTMESLVLRMLADVCFTCLSFPLHSLSLHYRIQISGSLQMIFSKSTGSRKK